MAIGRAERRAARAAPVAAVRAPSIVETPSICSSSAWHDRDGDVAPPDGRAGAND